MKLEEENKQQKEKRIIPEKQKQEYPKPISYRPDYYQYFYFGDNFFRYGNIQQAIINWSIAKGIAENAFRLPNGIDNIEDAKFDYGIVGKKNGKIVSFERDIYFNSINQLPFAIQLIFDLR